MADGDEIIVLPCHQRHFFHQQCITQWLLLHNICPLCKKEIEKD
jgi:hypothetical protein